MTSVSVNIITRVNNHTFIHHIYFREILNNFSVSKKLSSVSVSITTRVNNQSLDHLLGFEAPIIAS